MNENVKNKEEENKKLFKKIEILSNDINKNEEIQKLKPKLEKQEILDNDLNEELLKIKNDNEFLKNEIANREKNIRNEQY